MHRLRSSGFLLRHHDTEELVDKWAHARLRVDERELPVMHRLRHHRGAQLVEQWRQLVDQWNQLRLRVDEAELPKYAWSSRRPPVLLRNNGALSVGGKRATRQQTAAHEQASMHVRAGQHAC